MSGWLIEIAEESPGWAVRVAGLVQGTFADPAAAVCHARTLSAVMKQSGAQPTIRVYLTREAPASPH